MNYSDFRPKIRSAFLLAEKLELTTWDRFPNLGSLNPNEAFKRAALSPSGTYQDTYKVAIASKQYNFILKDFSFLQFSASQNGVHCASLRYCYYPNPFKLSGESRKFVDEFADEPAILDFLSQYYDEAKIHIGKPLIRYDFDEHAYRKYAHPAGHFHISSYQNCRLQVNKVLCPEAFAYFIAKHFYYEQWEKFKGESADANRLEIEYGDVCHSLEDVAVHLLSSDEKRQVSLG